MDTYRIQGKPINGGRRHSVSPLTVIVPDVLRPTHYIAVGAGVIVAEGPMTPYEADWAMRMAVYLDPRSDPLTQIPQSVRNRTS